MDESKIIRLAGIKRYAIEDGPGIRMAIYTQGCIHQCFNCHNKKTWSKEGGYTVTAEALIADIKSNVHIAGITLSGGDPFEQAGALYDVVKDIRDTTMLNIWAYSGYLFEELMRDKEKRALLELCDVLVDGRYIQAQRDLKAKWRGSRNQRIILVKESLEAGKAIRHPDNEL